MKAFMDEDFLLKTEIAKKLYKGIKDLPIIDYHCHIDPRDIATDRQFDNIAQVWLGGDHYKWRLMRNDGVSENEITGDADDRLKFYRFADALSRSAGNPMYHWTHLELKRYFGYDGVLNRDTADQVWEMCNQKLKSPDMSARGLILKSNVEVIGTTDDPADSLNWHKMIRDDASFNVKVVPSFRPDKAVNVDKSGYAEYISKLAKIAGKSISSVDDLKQVMCERLSFFEQMGCRAADHGLDYAICRTDSGDAEKAFSDAINGYPVSAEDAERFKTEMLMFFGKEYVKLNWVMQIHYSCLRNPNTVMFAKLGPDSGFDCISSRDSGDALARLLDRMNCENALPKTVIYSLDPNDNAYIDTVIGSFQRDLARGYIQHGAAWWFNDTASGIRDHMRSLANLTVFGDFIGMLTDSRSFLSYTRHEYFRRILCDFLGDLVESGQYPCDEKALYEITSGICCYNAKKYFGF